MREPTQRWQAPSLHWLGNAATAEGTGAFGDEQTSTGTAGGPFGS